MTMPPWTLPPKLTSVGSVRKRNVTSRCWPAIWLVLSRKPRLCRPAPWGGFRRCRGPKPPRRRHRPPRDPESEPEIGRDGELRRVQREGPRPGTPTAVGDDPAEQRRGNPLPAPAPRDEKAEHVLVVARRDHADDAPIDLGHEIALP